MFKINDRVQLCGSEARFGTVVRTGSAWVNVKWEGGITATISVDRLRHVPESVTLLNAVGVLNVFERGGKISFRRKGTPNWSALQNPLNLRLSDFEQLEFCETPKEQAKIIVNGVEVKAPIRGTDTKALYQYWDNTGRRVRGDAARNREYVWESHADYEAYRIASGKPIKEYFESMGTLVAPKP